MKMNDLVRWSLVDHVTSDVSHTRRAHFLSRLNITYSPHTLFLFFAYIIVLV
jgi:hypothetical protein